MATLNSKAFHIIVDKFDKLNGKEVNALDLATMLAEMPSVEEWSFILHDKDHTRAHYHINILMSTAHQPDTILFSIARDLMINVKCIGVRSVNYETLYMRQRYLIHLDSKDKYQYQSNDVFTNNQQHLMDCLGGINPYITDIPLIQKLCVESESIVEVYNALGLSKSNTYRNLIRDIWNDCLNKN